MCYRTPEGVEDQAKAGIWASGESGLLWFFSRDNAEILVKVLDGCSHNDHRWVFVAPVTTLEFNLWVTGPDGRRWTHSNEQGVTATTRSDTSAFGCSTEGDDDDDGRSDEDDEDEESEEEDGDDDEETAASDLAVWGLRIDNRTPSPDQIYTVEATIRNYGDGPSSPTTLRYFSSDDSIIEPSDVLLDSDVVPVVPSSGESVHTVNLRAPSRPASFHIGACVDSVPGESNTRNNCSGGILVDMFPPSLTGTWSGWAFRFLDFGRAEMTMTQVDSAVSGTWAIRFPASDESSGTLQGTLTGSEVSMTLYPADPTHCRRSVTGTVVGPSFTASWSTVDCPVYEFGGIQLTRDD